MMKPERPGDEQMIKELEEMVPITMLTEYQRQIAKEKCEKSYLESVKYINSILNEGWKIAKVYFDLYIDDRPTY